MDLIDGMYLVLQMLMYELVRVYLTRPAGNLLTRIFRPM